VKNAEGGVLDADEVAEDIYEGLDDDTRAPSKPQQVSKTHEKDTSESISARAQSACNPSVCTAPCGHVAASQAMVAPAGLTCWSRTRKVHCCKEYCAGI
jgi:hypothetical protein